MASIKDLRKRITSTKNTQQTTKAMKMVSAAKLRRAQDAITNHRPYARRIDSLIRQIAALIENPEASPLLRRELDPEQKKNVLVVVVTSDRGLCGAFNGNVIKAAARWVAANQSLYGRVEMSFVGKRGYDFFKNKPYTIGNYYQELGGKVTFQKARKLADDIVQAYLSGTVDEVKFVYNEFKNVMSQKVVVEGFLPLQGETITAEETAVKHEQAHDGIFIVKPNLEEVFHSLLAKHFAIQTFRILLESQAGEHGARMSAMESATKNAGEMIKKLTLQYNKQRQAGITKELLEIIAGSESQKG